MRMRIISAAVVLGLGLVGIALAQQGKEQTKPQAIDRAKLRAQVATLRAEVEVLALEHDVDFNLLKQFMENVKECDIMGTVNVPGQGMSEETAKAARPLLERPEEGTRPEGGRVE